MSFSKIKKQLSILLAVIMVFSAMSVFTLTANAAVNDSESVGETYTLDGFKYQIFNDNTIVIVGCTLPTANVNIPNTLNGHTVVEIGKYAFKNNDALESVSIPDTVKTIGEFAFYNCVNLKSANIPNNATEIGTAAFYKCTSLNGITIPAGVKTIGITAFECCTSLDNLKVESGNQNYIDIDGVLFSKDLKTLYQYPLGKNAASYVVPDTVTVIEEGAFAENKLTSLTFPEGLTKIGKDACGWSPLEEIVIPDSVTEIGNWAFCGCTQLKSAKLSKNTAVLPNLLFYNTALESIKIPEGVTNINKKAFANTKLTSVIVPKSVVKINSMALGYYEDEPIKDYTIKGYKQSAAETYANENGFKFIDVEQPYDVNLDGVVDVKDATLILKHITQIETLDDIQLKLADTNGDNDINVHDATLILKKLVQLI